MTKEKIEISKDVMEQYEKTRRAGFCNMYDYNCVSAIANQLKYYALASLTLDEYKYLLMNFGELMKKYNIKQ